MDGSGSSYLHNETIGCRLSPNTNEFIQTCTNPIGHFGQPYTSSNSPDDFFDCSAIHYSDVAFSQPDAVLVCYLQHTNLQDYNSLKSRNKAFLLCYFTSLVTSLKGETLAEHEVIFVIAVDPIHFLCMIHSTPHSVCLNLCTYNISTNVYFHFPPQAA